MKPRWGRLLRRRQLDALAERYEATALAGGRKRFEVTVDDAVFGDEAVVRVASVLDGIDPDWEQHLGWPTAQESATATRS